MPRNPSLRQRLTALMAAAFMAAILPAAAAPVTPDTARAAAAGWLALLHNPLRALPNRAVQSVHLHRAADGSPLVYEARLQPAGFLLVPVDDGLEPVLAFAARGNFDPSPAHPLGALAAGDLAGRMAALRLQSAAGRRQTNRRKWDCLIAQRRAGIAAVSDERVPPLVQTAWDQMGVGGALCYNYWTPDNYPCGCLATALAQLMRYHRYPFIGVGTPSFAIRVNGEEQTRTLMGGDGLGGPYVWDWMTLAPTAATPVTNRMEIGALCHDIGVAAGSHYDTWATGADLLAGTDALRGTFYYSQVIDGFNDNADITAALPAMLNPGLDAGLPSVLGIFSSDSGHAVLCDGYGYAAGTLYHHLNLGWGASLAADNAWYALPTVDTSALDYNVIRICAYNIFTHGAGEIISGRITDSYGLPLADAALTIAIHDGPTLTATSSSRGIYAFVPVPSNRAADLYAAKAGYRFTPRTVRTGASQSDGITCGNLWNVDFTGWLSNLPVPAEYDGDGRADPAWYDESTGFWKVWQSARDYEVITFHFGGPGWMAVPADYDGDGLADPAIYHTAAGQWMVLRSSDEHRLLATQAPFGGPGWMAAPADYDGDGRADPAIYQAAAGAWQALLSSENYFPRAPQATCGGPGWMPVPADYDGDRRADPAVHQAPAWRVLLSGDYYQPISAAFDEGDAIQAVPADYDGDGKADPAVFQPAAGQWIIHRSSENYRRLAIPFGGAGQAAAPADYNGDGRADLGLYAINDDSWQTLEVDRR